MNIKTNLANKGNYGGTRSTSAIKYIVVHYTGNDGDTDENNGNYFKNNVVGASAHYFVDDDSVTQTVPDNYVAWHCGAKTYKHDKCRNSNSIGVEICDDLKNGVIYPSDKTIANALELVEYLMKKYSVPKENVIRHYDVTGKLCPAYWCGTKEKDNKWLTAFWSRLGASKESVSTDPPEAETAVTSEVRAKDSARNFLRTLAGTYTVTASNLNVRHGAGTAKKIMTTIPKGTAVKCYGYYTSWCGAMWLAIQFTYKGVKYTGFASSKYLKK